MKRHWFSLLLLVIVLAGTAIAYPYLPDLVSVHWNYKGAPDSFAPKSYGVWMVPVIMVALYLFMMALPKIDPKKQNYARFQVTYHQIINGILFFLFLFQVVQISSDLGKINPADVIPEIVGVMFIFIGNLSPKFKPNYFVGIRTPWTLASEDVWKKTHRFGGKVFVVLGLLFLLVPVIPAVLQIWYVAGILVIGLGLIVLSSYYFFVKG